MVTSRTQTKGRGRKDHVWSSESSENLYFSGLVELDLCPALPLTSLFCGAAVLRTCMEKTSHSSLRLKWPNDIYKENKKISGLLLEMDLQNDRAQLIVGIGVNFFFERIPDHIPTADALFEKPLSDPEKEQFIFQLIENLNRNFLALNDPDLSQNEIRWIEEKSYLKDKRIQFEKDHKLMVGEFLGYDVNGFLKVKTNETIVVLMDTGPGFGVIEHD